MSNNKELILNNQYVPSKNRSCRISIIPFLLILILSTINIILGNKLQHVIILIELCLILMSLFFFIKFLPENYVIYLFVFGYCLLATFFNQSGLGTIIAYFSLMTMLIISRETSFTDKELFRLDLIFLLCLAILLIVFSQKQGVYYKLIWGDFRLNPNCYATLLLAFSSMSHRLFKRIKNKIFRTLINLAFFISNFYFLLQTDARASMVSYLVYCAFSIIFLVMNHKQKYNVKKNLSRILFFILTLSILGVFVYILLYRFIGKQDLIILGKNLFTGREKIWIEALDLYSNNWLFGFSNKHKFLNRFYNVHNGLLTILCHLSFVGFLGFITMFSKSVQCKNDQEIDIYKYFSLLEFIFLATYEALYLDNMLQFVLIPFLLNKRRIED